MDLQPKVRAIARLRCAQCGAVFAQGGEFADRIVYRLLFSGLKIGDQLQVVCRRCSHGRATVLDAGYLSEPLTANA